MLNNEGMYVALAFNYQVDVPWEEKEEDKDKTLLCDICNDICEIFQKAVNGQGRSFIKYYY